MSRVLWRLPVLLALLLVPATASAAARFGELGGHLSIGYAKMFSADPAGRSFSPGGSISLAAGLDYPLARALRGGLDLGYHLLGSRSVQEGSMFGSVDYSALEVTAFLHWLPPRGPVRRVSLGPGLLNAHGSLSVTGGGAGFGYLAVHETAAAVAVQATLMPGGTSPVKPGLELGVRRAFLAGEDWTTLSVRGTVHY